MAKIDITRDDQTTFEWLVGVIGNSGLCKITEDIDDVRESHELPSQHFDAGTWMGLSVYLIDTVFDSLVLGMGMHEAIMAMNKICSKSEVFGFTGLAYKKAPHACRVTMTDNNGITSTIDASIEQYCILWEKRSDKGLVVANSVQYPDEDTVVNMAKDFIDNFNTKIRDDGLETVAAPK